MSSLRWCWRTACRRCSNYISILDLTLGFIGLGKYNCKTRRETFIFGDLLRPILEILPFSLIWALVVLAALALFIYINIENLRTYYRYPTTVNIEVNYKSPLTFPAVTVCNYNTHRYNIFRAWVGTAELDSVLQIAIEYSDQCNVTYSSKTTLKKALYRHMAFLHCSAFVLNANPLYAIKMFSECCNVRLNSSYRHIPLAALSTFDKPAFLVRKLTVICCLERHSFATKCRIR